ncbi:MAG: hypothetical protein A2046_14515 [Bacteroidetes bacterium GWA2_30_7]|nr:MAG: hypothetical protein A2046_14515 [Bacteroidetes bacterium GWA2_30_7]
MKTNIIIIITSIVISTMGFSQIVNQTLENDGFEPTLIQENYNSKIEEIDKITTSINKNIDNYQKIEKVKNATGNKYNYYKSNELQLVTVEAFENNLTKKVCWYFQNNQLIFSDVLWTNNESGIIVKYVKAYLQNEKLFAWIKTDNSYINPNSQEFKDADEQLREYASTLK